jgi:DNA-binding IclR family transcriptional regulator
LGWISDDKFYVVAKDHGSQIVAVTFRLGQRFPLYWGAHGKAILSVLHDEERDKILSVGVFAFRDKGEPYDLARLEKVLALCRKNGYAVDVGEQTEGINVVAAPVFGPTAKILGAFVVIGTFPVDLVEEYGQLVAAEAREFSHSMAYFTFGRE